VGKLAILLMEFDYCFLSIGKKEKTDKSMGSFLLH